MHGLIDYFETIPASHRVGILGLGIALFWLLENASPLVELHRDGRQRRRHAARNLVLTELQLLVGLSFVALMLLAVRFGAEHRFGLLQRVEMPLWLEVVVALLVLDLIGAYAIHWLEHRVPLLWRFHVVHHTDREVDVTTGLRHHPVETVFRSLATIVAAVVVGAPLGVVLLYQTISVFFAHMTHANVRWSSTVDRALARIFVTPYFHKVHHHDRRPMTDANYGNIFSVWDRLFRTAIDVADPTTLRYGIDTHSEPQEHGRLGNLLLIPFQRWRQGVPDPTGPGS